MTIEDLSTYTEKDPNSHITVVSGKVTGAGINRNERAYLYKDFGADYFNGFNINFEFKSTELSTYDIGGLVCLTNSVGDRSQWTGDFFWCTLYCTSGSYRLYLDPDYYIISVNTLYYCTLSRVADSDTISLKIYSDSARTNLLDTLTTTISASAKFRYMYAITSQYTYHNYGCSYYVENVEILTSGTSIVPLLAGQRFRRIS